VRAGAPLVRLDDALISAERDKALASRDQARLDLERLQGLARRQAAAQDEVAQAQTALALAQAELAMAEIRLAHTRVPAPFDGVVTERLVEPGDFVTKNTHLLSLADPASLVARVRVSELSLPHLAEGDPVGVRIDALGADTAHSGRILRIHPVVEEASRQGIVEVGLDPVPPGARAGQFARVTLSITGVARLLLPFQALQRDREGEFVWVVGADDTAVRRAVQTGLRIADGVEILSGLNAGERVIVRGLMGLVEGKGVKVVQR
jgi:RND family efflux transporter MFP subunit